ncbi:MAG: hypothetical protein U9N00_02780 [Candidatus Bipolaricaulota bacterium]|nr:hypothetical protein [Candidatus Bipolaricaulota bacterium]
MHKKTGLLVMILFLVAVSFVSFAQEEENLSADRNLGVGMQIGFPWGGLVSGRYWITPQIGVEGIVFAGGSLDALDGLVTGRFLYRLADTETVDFYVAAGATFPFSPYGEGLVLLSVVGGIEFTFPFASSLSWNLEFGGAFSTTGDLMMAFGTGVHFYF